MAMKRRSLLKGLAIGGAALSAPAAAQAHETLEQAVMRAGPTGAAPWHLIAPLTSGSYVGAGWKVESLSTVAQGVVVLTLAHARGERAELHLCRRRGAAMGMAQTHTLDLFLMNGGAGKLVTESGIGRAVKTVAAKIRANERMNPYPAKTPPGMMSHPLRLGLYGPPHVEPLTPDSAGPDHD